jgi:hypothetical protein
LAQADDGLSASCSLAAAAHSAGAINDDTIISRTRGAKVWKNTFHRNCPDLKIVRASHIRPRRVISRGNAGQLGEFSLVESTNLSPRVPASST